MTRDEERRKRENEELVKRMREGHNLCHTGLQAYRWAPRPKVEKDRKEMARLYGGKDGDA